MVAEPGDVLFLSKRNVVSIQSRTGNGCIHSVSQSISDRISDGWMIKLPSKTPSKDEHENIQGFNGLLVF